MEKEKFIALIEKFLSGSATEEEMSLLSRHYSLLEEKFPEWNTESMGDQAEVKSRLFEKISKEINPKGKQKYLWWRNWQSAAAAVVFLVGIWAGLLLYQRKPAADQKLTEAATGSQNIKQLVLNDGTHIWLNKDSKLSYPEKFSDSLRVVNLSGEAYFEVSHDKDHPFVITTDQLETRVLGTRFVIKSYTKEPEVHVAVVDGKVKVSSKGSSKFVTPYQQVIFNKRTKTLTQENIEGISDLLLWTGKKITYRNVRLEDVAADLSRIFSVKISVDKRLNNCLIHADFLYSDTPGQILNFLATSLNGKVTTKVKSRYYLAGTGCN